MYLRVQPGAARSPARHRARAAVAPRVSDAPCRLGPAASPERWLFVGGCRPAARPRLDAGGSAVACLGRRLVASAGLGPTCRRRCAGPRRDGVGRPRRPGAGRPRGAAAQLDVVQLCARVTRAARGVAVSPYERTGAAAQPEPRALCVRADRPRSRLSRHRSPGGTRRRRLAPGAGCDGAWCSSGASVHALACRMDRPHRGHGLSGSVPRRPVRAPRRATSVVHRLCTAVWRRGARGWQRDSLRVHRGRSAERWSTAGRSCRASGTLRRPAGTPASGVTPAGRRSPQRAEWLAGRTATVGPGSDRLGRLPRLSGPGRARVRSPGLGLTGWRSRAVPWPGRVVDGCCGVPDGRRSRAA